MRPQYRPSDPCLVVLAPEALRGRRIERSRGELIVGRGEAADVRLDDPYVSRSHAVVRRLGSHVVVEDLGSTGGTRVNGRPLSGATPLASGDVVRFADVETVFQAEAVNETTVLPLPSGPLPPPASPAVDSSGGGFARFDVRDQQAGVISRNARVSCVRSPRPRRGRAIWSGAG
ncbi:MAG: FHA domain-containing protein [Dermatophilaceae bacterium]